MKRKEINKIFYSLCYEDIISVTAELGIKLTDIEIERIGRNYQDVNWRDTLRIMIQDTVDERQFKRDGK